VRRIAEQRTVAQREMQERHLQAGNGFAQYGGHARIGEEAVEHDRHDVGHHGFVGRQVVLQRAAGRVEYAGGRGLGRAGGFERGA
jgi:hypothetical protein